MHHVFDVNKKSATERTARMAAGKVVARKVACNKTGNRQRVADGQCDRRGIGRCQIEGAGFVLDVAIDRDVGISAKGRFRIAGKGNKLGAFTLNRRDDRDQFRRFAGIRNADHDVILCDHSAKGRFRIAGKGNKLGAFTLNRRDDRDQFRRFAGIRNADHDVILCDHPQVPVCCFGCVNEVRRRSGGGKCSRKLRGNMARFTNAGKNQAPLAVQDQFHRLDKRFVEPLVGFKNCIGFVTHDGVSMRKNFIGVKH